MTTTPEILRAAAAAIERLEARNAELEALLSADTERMRLMYRRGYFAGRSSERRGAARESSPERHARGELRRRLAR